MTFDVACAGAVYLDLTFVGLNGMPQPGAEHWAEDLVISPGGMANTAIGLARLGLNVALASPIGTDLAGKYLRSALEGEGITCTGPSADRSAMTAVVPIDGDRALVSFAPWDADQADGLQRVQAHAAVVLVDRLACAPIRTRTYALTSHAQVRDASLGLSSPIGQAHAIIANAPEALALTGATAPTAAALALARTVDTAVVTLGEAGALAANNGLLVQAPAPRVNVKDATGAGDLFAAAYIWADLRGCSLVDRLRWATLYASLSLNTVTAFAGAVRLDELQRAGFAAGLRQVGSDSPS